METNMFIPVWVKILALILSILAVFTLAAWELVVDWLMGVSRFLLSMPQRATKGTSKEEIKLGKQIVAKSI